MRSSYRRIGDFIQQVKVKNKDGACDQLLGINIDKYFMPSVANIVGTDLTKYKVVQKNQFACNRMHVGRDNRIPLALSQSSNPFIVSPAYTVFEITNTSELYPEYLMMWFSRAEFDREAWFHTDADVRGGLPWNLFCDIELPVPSIEKQREIVKEYNTIVNRIKLNEQLNQKLEETAQALYKHWFVDFEFPNENGQPYKSSGGKMIYNEELDQDIPKNWSIKNIGDKCEVIDCLHSKKPLLINDGNKILLQLNNLINHSLIDISVKYLISEEDYLKWTSRIELKKGDCVVTNVGKDAFGQVPKGLNAALGRNLTAIRPKNEFPFHSYLITLLNSTYMKEEVENFKDTGTIMQALNVKSIPKLRFIYSNNRIEEILDKKLYILRNKMEANVKMNNVLENLRMTNLSKMSKVESLKTEQVL